MVHQPLKLRLRQTLEAYPGLTHALSSTPEHSAAMLNMRMDRNKKAFSQCKPQTTLTNVNQSANYLLTKQSQRNRAGAC